MLTPVGWHADYMDSHLQCMPAKNLIFLRYWELKIFLTQPILWLLPPPMHTHIFKILWQCKISKRENTQCKYIPVCIIQDCLQYLVNLTIGTCVRRASNRFLSHPIYNTCFMPAARFEFSLISVIPFVFLTFDNEKYEF